MDDVKRVAVVTGGNRGIGFEVSRQLARKQLTVILTSRDQKKGTKAVEKLREQGLEVGYHQLDVVNAESIVHLEQFLRLEIGRLDVLVNNAGVSLEHTKNGVRPGVVNCNLDIMRSTMETNFFGPLILCKALVPLMQQHRYGRIVNVSSSMGQITEMKAGWPAYRISKAALNSLTCTLADELRAFNILVNSVCPGWVKTDMGGPNATRSAEEAVDTIVWLATLPDDGPTGEFFRDKEVISW